MEHRQDHFLRLGVQIDQQVPAGDQVEFGKRRIFEDVLLGEHHHVADILVDTVGTFVPGEETVQPFGRNVGGDAFRVDPGARSFDRDNVDIGRKDLDRRALFLLIRMFPDQDGDRVRLFAGGTAGHPDTHALPGGIGEMRADDVFPKRLERLRVAEEAGDSDQQFPEKRIHLQRGIPEIVDIVLDALDLGDGHSPLDAALDRVPLVQRKIMGRPCAKQEEDLLQKVRCGRLGRNDLLRPASESARHIGDQLLRHFRRRQNIVHHSGEDGAARHPVVRRRIESLGHRHAAFALDHLETEAAAGAGAREDDADRPLLPVLRQRAEEEVDRQAQTARRTRFQQSQLSVQQTMSRFGGMT